MEGIILVAAVGIAVFLFAFLFIKKSYYRARGKRVEAKAINSIKLPKGWKMTRNVPLPRLGDADMVITDPKGGKFVVEIKSFEGAKKAKWWDRKQEIVRLSGRPFSKDAIAQVLSQSDVLGATPIVWLPLAKSRRPFKTRSNVLVVQGNRKQLLKAMGGRFIFYKRKREGNHDNRRD